MINISWEINAIVAAKYAWEIRQPLSRIIEKLAEETDTEIASLADNVLRRTRYLAQMRRTVIQAFITARQNNKFGSSVMDRELIQFFTATVARGSTEAGNADEGLHPALIHALKELNKGGEEELVNIQDEAVPQTMLVSENSPTGYAMFNIYDSELQEEVPGITVRGTALGIGQQDPGKNLLPMVNTTVSANWNGTYLDFHEIDWSRVDVGYYDYKSVNVNTNPVTNANQWLGYYKIPNQSLPNTDMASLKWFFTKADYDYYIYDRRSINFNNAEFFATLPAGNYKFIVEMIDVTNAWNWGNPFTYWPSDISYSMTGCGEGDSKPWVALVDQNNNQVLQKTYVGQSGIEGAPTAISGNRFIHEEYPFTIESETTVGTISKIYYPNQGRPRGVVDYEPRGCVYFRYMIVLASDTPPSIDLSVTGPSYPGSGDLPTYIYKGVCDWEPYGENATTLTVEFTNMLNLKTYQTTLILPHKLKDNETVEFFTTTAEQEVMVAALKDSGLNPNPLGLIKVDILEKDDNNQGAHITTHYRR